MCLGGRLWTNLLSGASTPFSGETLFHVFPMIDPAGCGDLRLAQLCCEPDGALLLHNGVFLRRWPVWPFAQGPLSAG